MRFNPPSGFKMYGGTDPCYQPAADGTHWFSQCAEGPKGFGLYVFQQANETAKAKEISYGSFMPGRGIFCLGGNGVLYVTGSIDNIPQVFTVPGFARFTSAGPVVQPIGVVTPVVDQDARNAADAAKSAASAAGKAAEAALTKVELHDQVEHVTLQQVADLAWTKAHDAIFASAHDGFLSSWTWQKALDAAFLFCKQRGLVV
jgi:hypothetical protein